jgi:predicted alpha-1,6-mannanase (GH76 family)
VLPFYRLKNGSLIRWISLVWVVVWIMGSGTAGSLDAESPRPTGNSSYSRRAALAVETLQSWYNADTGLYRTTGWWNAANAITVLVDYSRVSGSKKYWPVFANTFSAAQKTFPGFINKFYDDEGWWALAWIDAYELTRDVRFLRMAQQIFADMAGGWDETCKGGIWWSKDRKYKNAIANELFLDVAATLAAVPAIGQRRAGYREWAEKEWRWFTASGMINSQHLVNDGLDGSCANNQQTTWSYNQGVIVGGLVALNLSTGDADLLTNAKQIGEAAVTGLTDANGILHDACEPRCGEDGTQFKGILVRNLRLLNAVKRVPAFEQFTLTNAESVWAQVRPGDYRLGPIWTAPFGPADASSETSALDLLVTAASISGTPQPH